MMMMHMSHHDINNHARASLGYALQLLMNLDLKPACMMNKNNCVMGLRWPQVAMIAAVVSVFALIGIASFARLLHYCCHRPSPDHHHQE